MKPYPLPSCSGPCMQGRVPCRQEARCTLGMHRVTVDQVTDREYAEAQLPITMDDDESTHMQDLAWAIVVVAVVLVLSGLF